MTTETGWHPPASAGMVWHTQLSVSTKNTCHHSHQEIVPSHRIHSALHLDSPLSKPDNALDSQSLVSLLFRFLLQPWTQMVRHEGIQEVAFCMPSIHHVKPVRPAKVVNKTQKWLERSATHCSAAHLINVAMCVCPQSPLKPTGPQFITFIKAGADKHLNTNLGQRVNEALLFRKILSLLIWFHHQTQSEYKMYLGSRTSLLLYVATEGQLKYGWRHQLVECN